MILEQIAEHLPLVNPSHTVLCAAGAMADLRLGCPPSWLLSVAR